MSKINIGVLALQGSFIEHISILNNIDGVRSYEVKTSGSLEKCDGLIIPGGESTTMGKLLTDFGIKQYLSDRIHDGMPVWGTCAGAILLADEILDEDDAHLKLMNMSIRRNAYGSQLDSFKANIALKGVLSDDESVFPAVFIRAPIIEAVYGNCRILGVHQDKIVAAQENNMLATTFHPELTHDQRFHEYFAKMVACSV